MRMRMPIHVAQAYPRPRSACTHVQAHAICISIHTSAHTSAHLSARKSTHYLSHMSVRMPQATCSVSSSRPHCSRTASRRPPAPRPPRPSAFDHFHFFPCMQAARLQGAPVTRVPWEAPSGPPFNHFFHKPRFSFALHLGARRRRMPRWFRSFVVQQKAQTGRATVVNIRLII